MACLLQPALMGYGAAPQGAAGSAITPTLHVATEQEAQQFPWDQKWELGCYGSDPAMALGLPCLFPLAQQKEGSQIPAERRSHFCSLLSPARRGSLAPALRCRQPTAGCAGALLRHCHGSTSACWTVEDAPERTGGKWEAGDTTLVLGGGPGPGEHEGQALTTMRLRDTQQSSGKSCSMGTRNWRQPSQ